MENNPTNQIDPELKFQIGENVQAMSGDYKGVITAWFEDIGGIHYDVDTNKGSQTFLEESLKPYYPPTQDQ